MDIGSLRHLVTLQSPGAAVPDGEGGFTQVWTELSPSQVWASIVPASARDLERVAAGTVLSTASHVVRMRYHGGVTTKTRMTKGPRNTDGTLPTGSREFQVTGVTTTEERNIETVAICVEVVP